MSQRNPMNERYTSEERTGTTRKSAASAKPKAKAAASVTVKSAKKTPEQRKAEEKAARKAAAAKQREVERKYYKPDTPRYKRLRLIWWILLIAAIGCTTLSFVGQQSLPPQVAVVTLMCSSSPPSCLIFGRSRRSAWPTRSACWRLRRRTPRPRSRRAACSRPSR